MAQVADAIPSRLPVLTGDPAVLPEELNDVSPFGMQGSRREVLQILDPDCVGRLAATLALTGSRQEIRSREFVDRTIARHPQWVAEYQVVRLIEKSLWIQGHCDLVMTLTRNPSQIPDDPPPAIMKALARSYALHPEAATWYGVPLFSEQKNRQGLPIPLLAHEIREEHEKRILAAQQNALRWGWLYRLMAETMQIPGRLGRAGAAVGRKVGQAGTAMVRQWRQARRDARLRRHAQALAELQYARTGRVWAEMPEHSTLLGRLASRTGGVLGTAADTTIRYSAVPLTFGALTGTSLMAAKAILIAKAIPTVIVPMAIVATDPFLFVELPEEPGRLRLIGHWYWQQHRKGRKQLHLHV